MHIAGDDFKSGQTKFKSVLVDFLINAGIKVSAIASYNHLGNNDGKNLQVTPELPLTFKCENIIGCAKTWTNKYKIQIVFCERNL